jgi:hypothetical protein
MTPSESHAIAVALQERIGELRQFVDWYRTTMPWLRQILAQNERQHRAELAALLRIQRRAQRASKQTTSDRAYHELGYHAAQAR